MGITRNYYYIMILYIFIIHLSSRQCPCYDIGRLKYNRINNTICKVAMILPIQHTTERVIKINKAVKEELKFEIVTPAILD